MLREIMEHLASAKRANDETKSKWEDLLQEGSDDAFAAMREFRSAQSVYEQKLDEFIGVVQELKNADTVESEVDSLGSEMFELLKLTLRNLQRQDLLAERKPDSLESLMLCWFKAAATLDAAKRVNQMRSSYEPDEFEDMLDDCQWRDPQAWKRAVEAYRSLYKSLGTEYPDADPEQLMGEATHSCMRRAQSKYDKLTETVQSTLEDMPEGRLSAELSQIDDVELVHKIQSVVNSGLIRQRQLAPQAAKPRPVALMEPETETDIVTEVEEFLRGL